MIKVYIFNKSNDICDDTLKGWNVAQEPIG